MKKGSRTAKSIKNSSVASAMYIVNIVLQFFSRKIFLDYLGTEVLGLNTTATNLLQFLNLAELGVGAAVGFSLYRPIYNNDEQTINDIIALQRTLYRRIAYVVFVGAGVLMCFFPLIFAKMPLPLWYAYASFGVLLFSSLLSYFVNYKQVLFSANQEEYKIQYYYKAPILVKVLIQMVAVKYFKDGYVWWLALEVAFSIIASCLLNRAIEVYYPFVKKNNSSLTELKKKYPEVLTKVKQIFLHRIATFTLTQVSPLIIYGLSSLTVVALYGNYMLIVQGFVSLAYALSNGLTASIGNLIVEGNKEKVMLVFDELFSVRFFMASVMCFMMMTFVQPFVSLWIGKDYLLPLSTLILITGILFVQVIRDSIQTFLVANGFFSDVWAPFVEAISNIGLSILLGCFWGLDGILMGVLISLVAIVLIWKPIFLFAVKQNSGLVKYMKMFCRLLISSCILGTICFKLVFFLSMTSPSSFEQLLFYSLFSIIGFSFSLGMVFWSTEQGFRFFCRRLLGLVLKR